jgi:hypothetical protein
MNPILRISANQSITLLDQELVVLPWLKRIRASIAKQSIVDGSSRLNLFVRP